jgi:hypothetical protein
LHERKENDVIKQVPSLSVVTVAAIAGRDIDSRPTFGTWRVELNRFRQLEATVGGQKTIINGHLAPGGAEVPWTYKCGS